VTTGSSPTPLPKVAALLEDAEEDLLAFYAFPGAGSFILGVGSSAIGTLVERSTRFTLLLQLPPMHGAGVRAKTGPALAGHGAEAVRNAIADTLTTLPEQLRRSLTWDQGSEMAQHAQLRIDTGLQVYFCDPHSPWQRGTNDNTNGLLRQYFPKGTDLSRPAPTTSPPSRPHSTPDRARHSTGNAGRGVRRAPTITSTTCCCDDRLSLGWRPLSL
jgi:hypothetical protein